MAQKKTYKKTVHRAVKKKSQLNVGDLYESYHRVEDLSPKHLGKQSHRSCLEI